MHQNFKVNQSCFHMKMTLISSLLRSFTLGCTKRHEIRQRQMDKSGFVALRASQHVNQRLLRQFKRRLDGEPPWRYYEGVRHRETPYK